MLAKRLLVRVAVISCAMGCTPPDPPPPPEPVRAEATYRAFKAIEGAVTVGVNRSQFSELLQRAATELLTLKDVVTETADTLPYRVYGEAFLVYQDAGTLWTASIDAARYDFIPSDRIHYSEGVIAVVAKYQFPKKAHYMESIKATWHSVSDSTIQVLLSRAGSVSTAANENVAIRIAALAAQGGK